jgi:hypothetical protein
LTLVVLRASSPPPPRILPRRRIPCRTGLRRLLPKVARGVEVVVKACCIFVESLLLISTSEEINMRASASCSTKTSGDSTTPTTPSPGLRILPEAETAMPATAALAPKGHLLVVVEAVDRPPRGGAPRRAAPPARPQPRTSARGRRDRSREATPARPRSLPSRWGAPR